MHKVCNTSSYKGQKKRIFILSTTLLIMGLVSLNIENVFVSFIFEKNNQLGDKEIGEDPRLAYWENEITQSVYPGPENLFIGDANNDGYNDIVTVSWGGYISIVLWNTTSDNWDPYFTKPAGTNPISVYVGDANNDGYNDIVTANVNSDDVSILLWNSSSDDWDPEFRKSAGNAHEVVIGDANNDGYNDICIANADVTEDFSLYLWDPGIGDGDWGSEIKMSVGLGDVYQAVIEDVNNDGFNDIITANYGSTVSIFLWNNTLADWDPQIIKTVGDYPRDVFAGDVNNDGYNDIVTYNDGTDDISILLWNNFAKDWDTHIQRPVFGGAIVFSKIYVNDVNNDGYNDIVACHDRSVGQMSIVKWNPITNFWDPTIIRTIGNSPVGISVEDVNNDGYNDIAIANYYGANVSILLWNPPASIEIKTPENKTYTNQMIGYYPGVYGFEDEMVGETGINIRFVDSWNGAPISVSIESEIEGHKNVLRQEYSGGTHGDLFHNFDNNHISGQYEFWFRSENPATISQFLFMEGGLAGPHPQVKGGYFNYYDGTEHNLIPFKPDEWYHLAFEWYSNNTFDWYINGTKILEGGSNFHNMTNGPDRIRLTAYPITTNYFDAFGNSWDTNYRIGNNLVEGILLSFTPDNFDLMHYSLDEKEKKFITGNTTIPFPKDGLHTIQVFGYNLSGDVSQSAMRFFTVKTKLPKLNIEITDQSFSSEHFNFTFFIYNESGHGIDFAVIEIWWNQTDNSGKIENLGGGYYFISLDAILVNPDDNPILLNIIISVLGYELKVFETYIAVDPEVVDKTVPSEIPGIPGYSLIILIGVVSVISIILLKRKNIK
ncbi:MAG: FG-GAP-like repeat-containing protein [Promethearchaeota archaeon]